MFNISLAQWSLYRTIFSGKLHPMDFPRFARDTFGIDAVELVSRCFKDHYADEDLSYIPELKQRCDDLGVTVLLMMIDRQGDLADPDEAARTTAVKNHYPFVEAAKALGCHSIRVNAGGPGAFPVPRLSEPRVSGIQGGAARRDAVPAGSTARRDAVPAIDGLCRLCEFADGYEINVLVENHGGLSSNGAWLADLIRRVDHPRCGTLPDFGNFCVDWNRRDDPTVWYDRYKGVAELMPFAKAVSAKSNEFNDTGDEIHTDYVRMLRIVLDAGYRGYVGIEYEGPNEDEVAGIKATQGLLERVRSTIALELMEQ